MPLHCSCQTITGILMHHCQTGFTFSSCAVQLISPWILFISTTLDDHEYAGSRFLLKLENNIIGFSINSLLICLYQLYFGAYRNGNMGIIKGQILHFFFNASSVFYLFIFFLFCLSTLLCCCINIGVQTESQTYSAHVQSYLACLV